ncbi:hypothetical protein ACA910_011189 [Epithemia clementina (nom. ined.)]
MAIVHYNHHRRNSQQHRLLQRLALVVLLVLFLGHHDNNNNNNAAFFIVVVNARCILHSRDGSKVSLNYLPKGVEYQSSGDALLCREMNACREWTITNCTLIHCSQGHACQNTTFVDNQSIMCYSYASCQDARFQRSTNINCGMQAINACLQSQMDASGLVLCVGPHACVSDPDAPLHIDVGATGYVKCTDGKHAYSCQHLVVHVNHARRACIVASEATRGHCAVVCQGEDECVAKTIQFQVLPPV